MKKTVTEYYCDLCGERTTEDNSRCLGISKTYGAFGNLHEVQDMCLVCYERIVGFIRSLGPMQ